MALAEQGALGSMLIDAGCVPTMLGMLTPEDFEAGPLRELFQAIRSLHRKGAPVDAITAVNEAGWAKDAERRKMVAELMEVTPTSANAVEYAKLVREQATLRKVEALSLELSMAKSVDDCRAPAAAITEALSTGQGLVVRSMGETLTEFGERQMSGKPVEYIGLGFEVLDKNTFLELGDMLVLGGAPSDGKTALGLQIAWHMAKRRRVGFFSFETSARKLGDRLVSQAMDISFGRIKRNAMTEQDWDAFAHMSTEAGRRSLQIIEAGGMTVDQIIGTTRAMGFEIIFVDYAQLIETAGMSKMQRREQLQQICMQLHVFAQRSKTLVVLLSQLNRPERDSTRERDLFDLAETSQFERDADMVLLLYRPPKGARFDANDKESEVLDPDKTRILRIAKQKEGQRVRLPMAFDGDHQRFSVLTPDGRAVMRKLADAGRAARDRLHAEAMARQKQIRFDEIQENGEEPF